MDVSAYLQKIQQVENSHSETLDKLEKTIEKLDIEIQKNADLLQQNTILFHQSNFILLGNWFLATLKERGLLEAFEQHFPATDTKTRKFTVTFISNV